jgi:hypothetical protein
MEAGNDQDRLQALITAFISDLGKGHALIEAMILICALGLPAEACDQSSAQDVIRVKVEPVGCALAAQSVIAGMAGGRSEGRFMKVICGGRR